jgi:alpha-L-fucosidase
MEVGPRRDLVDELAKAIRNPSVISPQTNQPVKFGVYQSLYEWFNPMYISDMKSNWTSRVFVDSKIMPELYQLVDKYQPDIVWSDGYWTATSDYWRSTEFLAWLATNSSVKDTVVWNDRWGKETKCKYGSYWTCNDRYLPDKPIDHKWENAMTIDKGSWGWNRNATYEAYYTTKELIDVLVTTISRNGNILINVGPGADGTLSPIFVDRLLGLGAWLQVNSQAVYGSRVWSVCDQDDNADVFYTRDDELLYVFLTRWPADNQVVLTCPEVSDSTEAFILGLQDTDKYFAPVTKSSSVLEPGQTSVTIELPNLNPSDLPCDHVWVIAMTAIRNLDDSNNIDGYRP